MSFETGHKKVGGRKKGSLNKKSKYLFEALRARQFEPVDRLVEILPTLPPEKQAQVLVQLLGYLYPKRKPSDATEESSFNALDFINF